MKALVVYESMWGNTEKVAHAIAAGLGESMEVELAEVGSAPVAPGPEVRLAWPADLPMRSP
jgi:flavodoxin